ncbi:hypothetical protein BGZ94_000213, partial [Podila epigama]
IVSSQEGSPGEKPSNNNVNNNSSNNTASPSTNAPSTTAISPRTDDCKEGRSTDGLDALAAAALKPSNDDYSPSRHPHQPQQQHPQPQHEQQQYEQYSHHPVQKYPQQQHHHHHHHQHQQQQHHNHNHNHHIHPNHGHDFDHDQDHDHDHDHSQTRHQHHQHTVFQRYDGPSGSVVETHSPSHRDQSPKNAANGSPSHPLQSSSMQDHPTKVTYYPSFTKVHNVDIFATW